MIHRFRLHFMRHAEAIASALLFIIILLFMKNNRFAKLLALVLCMTAFAWSASAFEPEMPEPAAEVTEAAMASLSEAAYAAKPAESTAYGTLVFFDNGNPADAVSLTNMKLATLAETFGETDGYVTRSMTTYNGFTQGGPLCRPKWLPIRKGMLWTARSFSARKFTTRPMRTKTIMICVCSRVSAQTGGRCTPLGKTKALLPRRGRP